MVDTEDSEDCPAPEEEAATEEEPTPTPEADEEAARGRTTPTPEAEGKGYRGRTDEESETEICDNTIDDDGDGLVDTEDSEDCPAPEEEASYR